MLYLIGGASRTGKSSVASELARRIGVSVVSTDALVWALQHGAPELGVRHGVHDDKAASLFRFLTPFVEASTNGGRSLILEGDALRPEQAVALSVRFETRACFVGNVSAQAADLVVGGGWAADQPPDQLARLAGWVATVSREIATACASAGIEYFDVGARKRDATIAAAVAHLSGHTSSGDAPWPDVLFLAGAPGAGKSTLMNELASRWPAPVVIEFSSLRQFHLDRNWSNQSPDEEQLAWENLEFIVRNYVRHGRRPVIVTDLREHRVQMIEQVFCDLNLRVVTLTADEGVLRQRVGGRTEGFTDVQAAVEWNRGVVARATYGTEQKFDTSHRGPRDLALAVTDWLASGPRGAETNTRC
ncbi:MAG TPA: AAA family ATPase [Acidimicrobiales bacterium]|nr:AAA family ATPase [Acidimicrobiales bacterium]